MTQVVLSIPNEEVKFIQSLARKMGWRFEKKEDSISKFISSCEDNSDITDDEIQNIVNEIRYGK